jgi:hypothetical protein
VKLQRPAPLIGRSGVQVIVGDIVIGALALPLSALLRQGLVSALAGPTGELGAKELGSAALWITAFLSTVLWPLALRSVDSGYPSSRLPTRQLFIAAGTWLLAASGTIFLLDKNLESRALVLIATAIALLGSATIRRLLAGRVEVATATQTLIPDLGIAAETALTRGEPVAISIERLERGLPRPLVILDGGLLWIYPSVLSPAEQLVKRIFDLLFGTLLVVLTSPIMLIIAGAILVKNGRPIIFTDARAGQFGAPIRVHKFRTMRVGAETERAELWKESAISGPAFKLQSDPRVTPIGRILRKYSLDELPQFFDVIAGRMSLIGPRPAGLDELQRYENQHRIRLTVRPGVSGLWQVRRRIDDNFEERVADDLEYIARWSIGLDLEIIARTIKVVIAGRGI